MLKTKKTSEQKGGKRLQETTQGTWKWRVELRRERWESSDRVGEEWNAGGRGWSDSRRSCVILLCRYDNYYWRQDSARAGKKSWSAENGSWLVGMEQNSKPAPAPAGKPFEKSQRMRHPLSELKVCHPPSYRSGGRVSSFGRCRRDVGSQHLSTARDCGKLATDGRHEAANRAASTSFPQ
jgi:hypothetical protein